MLTESLVTHNGMIAVSSHRAETAPAKGSDTQNSRKLCMAWNLVGRVEQQGVRLPYLLSKVIGNAAQLEGSSI